MGIQSVDELRDHLRIAMRVELATVPLYLYALQSIDDPRSDAAGLIRSIVAEEMLHFALVANLLLAVGGDANPADPSLRPAYPSLLLNHTPSLTLNLAPATTDQIRSTFLTIEQPDPPGSPTEPGVYDSLGEFYADIAASVERFAAEEGAALFADPQADRQMSDPRFYGAIPFNVESSGDLMLIDSVASARAAIDVIIHQGEGLSDQQWADADHQELTHYAKFQRILDGTNPVGTLRPLPINPRAATYPPEARPLADLFNGVYAALFELLGLLYEPRSKKGGLVNRLYLAMTGLLGPIGRELTTVPIGGGYVAGPTFEELDLGPDPSAMLATLAEAVVRDRPTLAPTLAPLLERRLLPAQPPTGPSTPR